MNIVCEVFGSFMIQLYHKTAAEEQEAEARGGLCEQISAEPEPTAQVDKEQINYIPEGEQTCSQPPSVIHSFTIESRENFKSTAL